MKTTIHLTAPRGAVAGFSERCLACAAELEPLMALNRYGARPRNAVCRNRGDWETTYRRNDTYRRCIDADPEPLSTRARFPTPTEAGYYWADWRICADGTEDEELFTPAINGPPEIVEVWENDPGELLVTVGGYRRSQTLDSFVWRSAKLEVPKWR